MLPTRKPKARNIRKKVTVDNEDTDLISGTPFFSQHYPYSASFTLITLPCSTRSIFAAVNSNNHNDSNNPSNPTKKTKKLKSHVKLSFGIEEVGSLPLCGW